MVLLAVVGHVAGVIRHVVTERHVTERYRMTTTAATPSAMADVVHELESRLRVRRGSEVLLATDRDPKR